MMIKIPPLSDTIRRAQAIATRAPCGDLHPSTAAEYALTAARLKRARKAAGAAWAGLEGLNLENGTYYAARAAYVRLAHSEVAEALEGFHAGAKGALARLFSWLPEAERYPPRPDSDPRRVGEGSGRPPRGQHSKRSAVTAMPAGWLEKLWSMAVERRFLHLDALAVLICTGARPSEVCLGVAARPAGEGGLMIVVAGTKVSETTGQPWRKLSMRADTDAAQHVLRLAQGFPDGVARVNPSCTPGVLSDAISDLAGDRWGRRVSAYDIRHARAADARVAFGGDLERCARWLGHSSAATQRYYSRLPAGTGVGKAMPLRAKAPRAVRMPARTGVDPALEQGVQPE